jgi:hypothetical protein
MYCRDHSKPAHWLDSDKQHEEVRVSTYDKIAWLALRGGLTGLGLVLSRGRGCRRDDLVYDSG